MSDINILKFFMSRKRFTSTYNTLPKDLFDIDTVNFLKWFQYYYKKYSEDTGINVDKLSTLMKLDKGTDKATFDLSKQILEQLRTPLDANIQATILEQLEERRLAGEIGLLHKRWEDGDEIDFSYEVLTKAQESHTRRKVKHQGHWEDGDVWQMVQEDADNSGYLFNFLPRSIYMQLRGCNVGDNIGVCAPTDAGKTSFLANIAVSFAKQHKELYEQYLQTVQSPDWIEPENFTPMVWQPVLYLVNEGTSRKITPRVYQTALSVDREELFKIGSSGTLEQKYSASMGRRDAVRLVDIHGYTLAEVVRVIEQHNPFLVITDMTGRIRVSSGSGMNDVQQLEEAWEAMRIQAAIQKFIHVGTAQVSAEGFNNYYPPLSAVQNSKTGIQTTWDLALFIGTMSQPVEGNEEVRGISTPKNKLARSGCKNRTQQLTYFNAEKNTWRLPSED